jgi:hypothetical protein
MYFQGIIQNDVVAVRGANPGWKFLYIRIRSALMGPKIILLSLLRKEP